KENGSWTRDDGSRPTTISSSSNSNSHRLSDDGESQMVSFRATARLCGKNASTPRGRLRNTTGCVAVERDMRSRHLIAILIVLLLLPGCMSRLTGDRGQLDF